jgi:hypothetical protein
VDVYILFVEGTHRLMAASRPFLFIQTLSSRVLG